MPSFVEGGSVHPLFLNFRDREIEELFDESTYDRNRKALASGLIAGSLAFAFYYIIDYFILGALEPTIMWMRFLVFPAINLSLGIWLKFRKVRKRSTLDLLGTLYILAGQTLQFLVPILYPTLGPYYLFSFVLLSLYAQSSINSASFRILLPVILAVLTAFLVKLFLFDTLPTSDLALQSMVISMCFFLVIRSSYMIERGHRLDFLQKMDLEQRQQELLSKNKELEQFAYIASHDLQEPLRSITSFSNLLNEEHREQIGEDGSRYLDYLLEASNRMRNLIKGLLDYSRLGRELQLVTIETESIVSAIRVDLSVAISECGAKITAGKLPIVKGYETEFRQLLQNLLSNALKFRAKDVVPQIHISARQVNNAWEFSVKDNGIGIAPENHDKIFLIFQRLHTRTKYEGTGIGLANCRKIVELHGGNIRVQSQQNEGSNFIFTIPIR